MNTLDSPTAAVASSEVAKCHLLDLPPELRNLIYRSVLVQNRDIDVRSQGFDVPPLLSTCKKIRKEARSIFYYENTFAVEVYDFDTIIFHHFMRSLKERSSGFHEQPSAVLNPRSTRPHWPNMLRWLELDHAGEIAAGLPTARERLAEGRIPAIVVLSGMFTLVDGLRDLPRRRVKELIAELHAALVCVDRWWAEATPVLQVLAKVEGWC